MRYAIGIINAKNGEVKVQEEAYRDEALKVAEKVSKWFDRRDTFFSGQPIWNYWKKIGILCKFEALVSGNSWKETAVESVAVFEGGEGTEHEFYMERIE